VVTAQLPATGDSLFDGFTFSMPSRPYILAEAHWKEIKETRFEVAILPWGATEAHNFHLPYGTDNYESSYVAAESARKANEKGAKVIVLPTIPFGVNTGQLDIPLTINMNPSTQAIVLRDVVQSLEACNMRKLVIINSHGGNDFRQMIRELQPMSKVFIATINWWNSVDVRQYYDEAGDHAGELETSVMMEIAPEIILPLSDAGNGAARKFKLKGLREGLAWSPRTWTRVTDDTGVGNPSMATRDKGVRHLAAVTDRVSDFLAELAGASPEEMYE
jgi:creatinine amidohydrolase